MRRHTRTQIDPTGGEYPAATIVTFASAFPGLVHLSLRGGEDGSTDLAPTEARRLAAGLLNAADEADGLS